MTAQKVTTQELVFTNKDIKEALRAEAIASGFDDVPLAEDMTLAIFEFAGEARAILRYKV